MVPSLLLKLSLRPFTIVQCFLFGCFVASTSLHAQGKSSNREKVDTASAAKQGAEIEGRKIFEEVAIDFSSGAFSRDLPFDVPFVLSSTNTGNFDSVQTFYRQLGKRTKWCNEKKVVASLNLGTLSLQLRQRKKCSGEREVIDSVNLPIWRRNDFKTNFNIICPELKPNRIYQFQFDFFKKTQPSAGELANLRSTLKQKVTEAVVKSCIFNDSCRYNQANILAFQKTLSRCVRGVFGKNASVKKSSVFDSTSADVGRVRFLLAQLGNLDYLYSISTTFDLKGPDSGSSIALEALRRFLRRDSLIRREILRSAFPQVKSKFQQLEDLRSGRLAALQIMSNAVSGYCPLDTTIYAVIVNDTTSHFQMSFQPRERKSLISTYTRSYKYILGMLTFVEGLIKDEVNRRKLENYKRADPKAKPAIDRQNTLRLGALRNSLDSIAEVFFALAQDAVIFNREAEACDTRLQSVINQISTFAISDVSVQVDGTTSAEFKVRANLYVSADIGLAYLTGNYGLAPYLGTNVYLRPINKQAELHGLAFFKRFSFLVGLTLPFFGSDAQSDKLFSNTPALLTGGGLRLSHALRVNGGYAWMKSADTIRHHPSIGWTPFVSFSFDVNVGNVLNQLLSPSLKNTIQTSFR